MMNWKNWSCQLECSSLENLAVRMSRRKRRDGDATYFTTERPMEYSDFLENESSVQQQSSFRDVVPSSGSASLVCRVDQKGDAKLDVVVHACMYIRYVGKYLFCRGFEPRPCQSILFTFFHDFCNIPTRHCAYSFTMVRFRLQAALLSTFDCSTAASHADDNGASHHQWEVWINDLLDGVRVFVSIVHSAKLRPRNFISDIVGGTMTCVWALSTAKLTGLATVSSQYGT